jgi:hypothetical protein
MNINIYTKINYNFITIFFIFFIILIINFYKKIKNKLYINLFLFCIIMVIIIDIYIKKNSSYETKYGIPFQCVELIRRFFSITKNISFPNVKDAVDFFNNINFFISLKNPNEKIELKTFSYPYIYNYSYYLKPYSILFWKYNKTNFPYGHVALIIESNEDETTIIQQNLNPPIKKYKTIELFQKINCKNSKFLGIKVLSNKILSTIKNIDYKIIKL